MDNLEGIVAKEPLFVGTSDRQAVFDVLGHGGGGFLARDAFLRDDLEAGQDIGVLGRVVRHPVGFPVLFHTSLIVLSHCVFSWASPACGAGVYIVRVL